MRNKLILSFIGLSLLALVAGCSRQAVPQSEAPQAQLPVASPSEPVEDYASLVDHLRAAGATVESAGPIVQPFFSVEGQ